MKFVISQLLLLVSTGYALPIESHKNSHHEGLSWDTLPPLPQSRQEHSVAALNNRIYILGGILSDRSFSPNDPEIGPQELFSSINTTNTMQYFDLATSKWFDAAAVPIYINHGNLASANGKLYLLGGLSGTNLSSWNAIGESYVYDPATDVWSSLPSMLDGTARGASAVAVVGDKIYLAGGMTQLELSGDYTQASVAIVTSYNTATRKWTTGHPPLPGARDHVAGSAFGTKLYVTGGREFNQFNWKNNTWELDLTKPSAGWIEKAQMPVARGGLSYATIGHQLYTFGGEGDPSDPVNQVFPNTEVYNMLTDTWTELPSMPLPKHGVGAAAVDGSIYIPGGGVRISAAPSDEFEVFQPCIYYCST